MLQVEGVGLGAVAAAGKHGKFELEKLATWKAGQPVPFAFLADTFEAIAETTKRLVITSLLVPSASLTLNVWLHVLDDNVHVMPSVICAVHPCGKHICCIPS